MASVSISAPGLGSGFLYNNGSNNARVCITSETNEFDAETLQNWANEGFDVKYEPLNGGGKDYEARLMAIKGGLGVGENYAVIGESSSRAASCVESNQCDNTIQHTEKRQATA